MASKLSLRIEVVANIAILVVAVLLAVVLVREHLLNREAPNAPRSVNQPAASRNEITSGEKLTTLDVDWKQSDHTLVFAISSGCHFCTDSAPFYRALVQNKKNTRLVAVLPQSVEEGKIYLQKLGVTFDEVRQMPLGKIGVHGTPTLLLMDKSGSIEKSWVGKLASEEEIDVLKRLQL